MPINSSSKKVQEAIEAQVASGFPDGAFEGLRALNVQSYTESNVKLGLEFEASVLISDIASGAINETVLLTGSKPVIIKAREISFSGRGVTAYINSSIDYTGGNAIELFNLRHFSENVPETQILQSATIIDPGFPIFTPIHNIGNQTNQGKGNTGTSTGFERILFPNTAYLLRLESLDTQTQDIASYFSFYEGDTDLPLA